MIPMKLAEHTLQGFIEVLGSDAPAPGGGSVSALCAANGAALCAMVCRLTRGKKKYLEYTPLMEEIIPQADALAQKLTASIDKDTEAFNLVSAAFRMPKETEEQKAARSAKIAEGMLVSTKVPFETMELTLEALKLAQQMLGKFNTNAANRSWSRPRPLPARSTRPFWNRCKISSPAGLRPGPPRKRRAAFSQHCQKAHPVDAPFSFAGSVVRRSLSARFFQKDRIFAMDGRRQPVQSRAAARPSPSSACRLHPGATKQWGKSYPLWRCPLA